MRIMPSNDYLNKNNMSMLEALEKLKELHSDGKIPCG